MKSQLGVAVSSLAILLLASATTTATIFTPPPPTGPTTPPPPPPLNPGGWFRDFSTPLEDDPAFFIIGLKYRDFTFSPTFQADTTTGALRFQDPQNAENGGATTAIGADFSKAYENVHISGIVNPLGLPERPVSPDPERPVEGENVLGFVARGNLFTRSTYIAGINFIEGTLFISHVDKGYFWSAEKIQSNDAGQGGQPTLDTLFPDFKLRSYYLEFSVETMRCTVDDPRCPPPWHKIPDQDDALLTARLYDAPGGNVLLHVQWVDTDYPLGPGVAGVFTQSFDYQWGDPTGYPPLFGSFDDVLAVVPEPASVGLMIGLALLTCGWATLRSSRRKAR